MKCPRKKECRTKFLGRVIFADHPPNTSEDLKKVLYHYQFQIKDNGYYFSSLLWVRWIECIFNKNKKASIDNWTGTTFKSKLLVAVLQFDFAFTQVVKKIGIKMKTVYDNK